MGLKPEQKLNLAIESAAEATLHQAFKSWLGIIRSTGEKPEAAILRRQVRLYLAKVNHRLQAEGEIGLFDDLLDTSGSPIKQVILGEPQTWKEFYYNPNTRQSRIHRHEEVLPPIESHCFGLLVQAKGKVVPFSLFKYNPISGVECKTTEGVRMNIHRVLKKFPYSKDPKHIVNVARVGYRLESCYPE